MDARTLTLAEASKQLQNKGLSSEEITRAYLDRIETLDGKVGAFLSTSKTALADAQRIDEQRARGEALGPLAGIPVAVKNNICVQGWKTTAGSRILENYEAAYDATVTKRLKEAGMVLIGSTNMDEFAMGSSTETSAFQKTKNPWDTSKVPGGSSGGSAAAVAAGFVPAALGSDTGGSVRQPASLCGAVGLKPTYGRVSRYGLLSLASSLDQIGPITRTVEDAALLLQAIEGADENDATSVADVETTVPELLQRDVKGLRIGIPKEYFIEGMDEEVKASVMAAVKKLEENGATVEEISLPHAEYGLAAYYIIMPSEASSNLSRYDGIRYGYSSEADSLAGTYSRSRGEGFGREAKRRIMLGTFALSKGYYDAYYKKAMQARRLIRQDFDRAFADVDLIATPTSPSVAWNLGEKFDDPLTMYLSDIYTISVNLTSLPAMSLPCGFVNNLPVGLQLIGKPFKEATLFRAGACYQEMTDWHTRTPEI